MIPRRRGLSLNSLGIERYRFISKLGEGGFSEVFKAQIKETGEFVAIKCVREKSRAFAKLSKKDREVKAKNIMRAESEVMKQFNHPNLVKLIEYIEDGKGLYIIMRLAEGGELFDRIIAKGFYTENDASNILRQIIEGVGYIHKMGYTHRDIKPENILFSTSSDDSPILITDFGFCKSSEHTLYSTCGTLEYSAPEIILTKLKKIGYGREADCWSIGVLAYILLCGYPPFHAPNDDNKELARQISVGEYFFHRPYWNNISQSGVNFVRGLLTVDPVKRLTCENAFSHPWIQSRMPDAKNLHDEIASKMKETITRHRWCQLYCATQMIMNLHRSRNSMTLLAAPSNKLKESHPLDKDRTNSRRVLRKSHTSSSI